MRGRKKAGLDVVAAVQARTAQAASLAGIAGQELLSDPRLNPATRPHADRLLIEQQIKALDGNHALLLRRHRVVEARAAEAEQTLQAIALAERASSPARSVWELHRGRRLWSRLAVSASVVLAVGSAMGVEAAAEALRAPTGTGYLAEIGLTGLSTAAITYRSHLAAHRGELEDGSWQKRSLWVLMTVPLLISVVANLARLNALGAACAIGAAAFALLGAIVADRSAKAMADRADEVSEVNLAELHQVAMGHDLFTAVSVDGQDRQDDDHPADHPEDHPADRPEGGPEGEGEVVVSVDGTDHADGAAPVAGERLEYTGPIADAPDGLPAPAEGAEVDGEDAVPADDDAAPGEREFAETVTAWLAGQDPPEEGARAQRPAPSDDDPAGAARNVEPPGGGRTVEPTRGGRIDGSPGNRVGHIDRDQRDGQRRVQAATEARRAAGDETRKRVAAFLDLVPDASSRQIAEGLEISKATAKRHRRALRAELRGNGGAS